MRIKAVARQIGAAVDKLAKEGPVFPRIGKIKKDLPAGGSPNYEPAGRPELNRIRMLEAKTEYLLDEMYRLKSLVRYLLPLSDVYKEVWNYQLRTFNFQWRHLPYHDEYLSNEGWRVKAADDVASRLEVPKDWFRGKKILDAGCGPGRHTWTFCTLGAQVTAFDMSDNALEDTRRECAQFKDVRVEKRNILEPLPYDTDFDLVWSYGVLHCTGDFYRALKNIVRHLKVGGMLYFMVYTEPRRDNFFDYAYYHEIARIREATRHLDFEKKAAILEKIEGKSQALAWFDAISSEINELFNFEELVSILQSLGFSEIKRTMPQEAMQNIVARKVAPG